MDQPYLSVIIPAYNESDRIAPTIEKISEYLDSKKMSYEILVVDDGSTDGTPALIEKLAQDNPSLRLLCNEKNEGKGNAVKKGVLNSWGEMVFFTDADLSTPIGEIAKFFTEFPASDVVIGSRSIAGADVQIHEPIVRELLGKTFNKIVQLLCVPGIVDTQCGAKMFKKDAAHKIFPLVQTERFAFDVEVLYLARRLGYKIKEIPVRWLYESNTRVRTFLDGPKMLWDIFKIRWIHRDRR